MKIVKTLEEELENSKTDLGNLELHYKNFSYLCHSKACENCEILKNKVYYLIKSVDKLSKDKSNFETILASQKCVFGKSGLGFNPQSNKNGISKPFSKVLEKQPIEKSKQLVLTCFYCMKRGHFVRFCKIKKYFVLKGIMKWIPKDSKVPSDKCKTKGPTFIRGPNLVA